MWFFRSPEVVFGEGALERLSEVQGRCALIVTDATIVDLGLSAPVCARLEAAGLDVRLFAEVEPDPSLDLVRRGAALARECSPDWIVGLGGGSCLDAAKAIWVGYERPDLEPDAIGPVGTLGLRQKARLVAIPTTSGTGAEVTWPIVLTDTAERRKLSVGHPENTPDLAIVDPALVRDLPPSLTAETGLDVLTHAIEGYTCTWANDFSDGLCLQAARMVFEYLPRAYRHGAQDPLAREKMHNAATLAGLGFGNAMAALAHALGHALGAVLHLPHGRMVGLCLPYTVEFTGGGDAPTRYAELARGLGLSCTDDSAATVLAAAVRDLARSVEQPLCLRDSGIGDEAFAAALDDLTAAALMDSTIILGQRYPSEEEVRRLLICTHCGDPAIWGASL
jgi:alcohol dehydrogenase class IV